MSRREVDYAFYYPSRVGLIQVSIKQDTKATVLVCSNDHGAISHEMRSMIDAETLRSLGDGLFESIVPTAPTVKEMTGQGMDDQRCLGMCSKPISVQIANASSPSGKLLATLTGVLVVESLPVPLHISCKAPGSEALAAAVAQLTFSPSAIRFKASSVPPRFQAHPFWHDDRLFIGTHPGMRSNMSFLDTKNKQTIVIADSRCAHCSGAQHLQLCSRCRVTQYCSTTCQAAHWKAHKRTCKAPPA